ncbi:MAG: hypothetical protein LQ350_008383 [Teloschistes chrysophthalmus]|nr:MAG: hypothetical protein LQ350_008383 [Niorma chrysophthalma]
MEVVEPMLEGYGNVCKEKEKVTTLLSVDARVIPSSSLSLQVEDQQVASPTSSARLCLRIQQWALPLFPRSTSPDTFITALKSFSPFYSVCEHYTLQDKVAGSGTFQPDSYVRIQRDEENENGKLGSLVEKVVKKYSVENGKKGKSEVALHYCERCREDFQLEVRNVDEHGLLWGEKTTKAFVITKYLDLGPSPFLIRPPIQDIGGPRSGSLLDFLTGRRHSLSFKAGEVKRAFENAEGELETEDLCERNADLLRGRKYKRKLGEWKPKIWILQAGRKVPSRAPDFPWNGWGVVLTLLMAVEMCWIVSSANNIGQMIDSLCIDQGFSDGGQATLDGVILCCTSVSPEKRSELASIASQMGAVHKYDLTSDVTHLIVGDVDTPKYKFVAKERPDVKCLLPTWVEALREAWMEGGDPDVQALELRYRLPTLHNLRVCVTGFDDMLYRKKLEDDINNNGGEYRANLTKDVTHLIARDPSGSKYKYAMEWNIKIVAVEWLEQSLERGMILDEGLYSLFLPPAERGCNAWIRRAVSTSSLGKRAIDGDAATSGPRKLRRTASTRLNSQSCGLWTDIVNVKPRDPEMKREEWSEQSLPNGPGFQAAASSAATKSTGTYTGSSALRQDLFPLTSDTSMPPLEPSNSTLDLKNALFTGQRLYLHGFNEKQISVLQNHLLSHGAELLPDLSHFTLSSQALQTNEYLVVPHDMQYEKLPTIPGTVHQPHFVTNMWVERTLHRKQYIRPESHITNTPIRKFPIPGFERLIICSTGFKGIDRLHIFKSAELMGATYDEFLSPKASVLVRNNVDFDHEKLRRAREWNIPTVTAEWLWDCIRSGELRTFTPYLIQPWLERASGNGSESQKQVPTRPQKEGRQDLHTNEEVKDHRKDNNVERRGTHIGIHDRPPPRSSKARHEGPAKPQDEPPESASDPCDTKPLLPQPTTITGGPLQEITTNSSPPKPSDKSPSKSTTTWTNSTAKLHSFNEEPRLSSAIAACLAEHQHARTAAASASSSINVGMDQNQNQPRVRRKRQLFGRAPSNASNLSRASSVDTMNTDGVGTPLEFGRSASSGTITNATPASHAPVQNSLGASGDAAFDPLATWRDDDEDEGMKSKNEQWQLTQLGYEDPDAMAWREKVEKKLGGGSTTGKNNEGGGGGGGAGGRVKVPEIGLVKDVTGKGAGGVGKRTRLAMNS